MSKRDAFIQNVRKLVDAYGHKGSIYLFAADFADFKLINYHYGYERGDELVDAAVAFVQEIPECVYCERAAADQFIFLVFAKEKRTDEEISASYENWARLFLTQQRENYALCSLKFWCGIYEIHKHDDIGLDIDNANLARMEAKRTKAETVVIFKQSKLGELAEKKKQEQEIMQALAEKRFNFYLQPQVDLQTGEIIGAEALARRLDINGKILYPDSFVAVLEQNGGIVKLDFLILEKVCQYLRARLDKGKNVVRTSVNLSRLHVRDLKTADRLHDIVCRWHIPPELIMFELTESILLDEFDEAKFLGDRLRAMGYSTSVDDFGSGYAGINIWQQLVFDELKLDRQFLTEDPDVKPRNMIIIPGIVNIARGLGISVICEGVDKAEQCRTLLKSGCRYAQGYYFSKPVPPDDFYEAYEALDGRYTAAELNG